MFRTIAFDLLRIDVYGFESFAKYSFQKYPGHFLSPLRISGSAVETLFGQYKYNAGGKLDAVNYPTARAASLVRQRVSGHHSGKDYKDNELSTPQLPLKRIWQEQKDKLLNKFHITFMQDLNVNVNLYAVLKGSLKFCPDCEAYPFLETSF